MELSGGERIRKIRETASLLEKNDWPEIDMILEQHGISTPLNWHGPKSSYVLNTIKNASGEHLSAIHSFAVADNGSDGTVLSMPRPEGRVRLFFSHSSAQHDYVRQVGERVAMYGIEPFIAQAAIDASAEWVRAIETALSECDALVAFLHADTHASQWCDHEVGWALGRRRPVLPLSMGGAPYGLLAKYQAHPCSEASPYSLGTFIVDWLTRMPSVAARLSTGLVEAFVRSSSWDFTRSIVPFLERMESITDDDLARMENAAQSNIDISDCRVKPNLSGPEWVRSFVENRRGPSSAPEWPE